MVRSALSVLTVLVGASTASVSLSSSLWESASRYWDRLQQPLRSTDVAVAAKGFPSLKLNDGRKIPVVAYGLGTANGKHGNADFDESLVNITVKAIQTGFTHLDCAEAYGNEKELGAAIKASGIPRNQLFITTKATVLADKPIADNLAASLANPGLDYVDLYLIHSPYFAGPNSNINPALLQSKWAEMEALHAAGLARSIGVSNYIQEHLDPVLATATVVPAINQIEYHPYLQHITPDGSHDLLAYLRAHGIAASGYGGLSAITRAAPGPVDGAYEALAGKYNVSTGDVALRWTLDTGVVAITTSGKESRLQEYLAKLPAFALKEDEVREISDQGMKKHYRGFWTTQYEDDDWR